MGGLANPGERLPWRDSQAPIQTARLLTCLSAWAILNGMTFIADLHIHSHFSRATSRDLDPENLSIIFVVIFVTVVFISGGRERRSNLFWILPLF
jgi:hypothetical protein